MPEWFPQNHADINKLLHNVKIHNSINQTKTKMFCRVIFHNVLIYLFIVLFYRFLFILYLHLSES